VFDPEAAVKLCEPGARLTVTVPDCPQAGAEVKYVFVVPADAPSTLMLIGLW
jgi:hypothetical protein